MIVNKCPVCKSDNITSGNSEWDDGCAWQQVACVTCASTWDEVYTLQSIESIVDNSTGAEGHKKWYTVTVPEVYLTDARTCALDKEQAIENVLHGRCTYDGDSHVLAGTLDNDKFKWKVEEE